jgi:hypothetical protein
MCRTPVNEPQFSGLQAIADRARLLGDAVEHDFLTRPHFQPVAAVCSLEEEDVIAREPQYAFDRSGHVFVQAVGKFNDYYGAAAWRSHEATGDNATTLAPKLPKHHIHNNQPSTRFQAGKGLQGTGRVFQWGGAQQARQAGVECSATAQQVAF